jgi:hypothetical protein
MQQLCVGFLKESVPAVDYELDDMQLSALNKAFTPLVKAPDTTGRIDLLSVYECTPTIVDPYFKGVVVSETQLDNIGKRILTSQPHTEATQFSSKDQVYPKAEDYSIYY